ncbi:MAG TPA: hypothetical protein VJM49_10670, partial [Acidimicrobiales bacterium]|nr:hypothetical protein [Acidimicrobiales bacterium]
MAGEEHEVVADDGRRHRLVDGRLDALEVGQHLDVARVDVDQRDAGVAAGRPAGGQHAPVGGGGEGRERPAVAPVPTAGVGGRTGHRVQLAVHRDRTDRARVEDVQPVAVGRRGDEGDAVVTDRQHRRHVADGRGLDPGARSGRAEEQLGRAVEADAGDAPVVTGADEDRAVVGQLDRADGERTVVPDQVDEAGPGRPHALVARAPLVDDGAELAGAGDVDGGLAGQADVHGDGPDDLATRVARDDVAACGGLDLDRELAPAGPGHERGGVVERQVVEGHRPVVDL